jgi:hypothetical protein
MVSVHGPPRVQYALFVTQMLIEVVRSDRFWRANDRPLVTRICFIGSRNHSAARAQRPDRDDMMRGMTVDVLDHI